MGQLKPDPGTVIDVGGSWAHVLNRNQSLLGKVMLVLARDCDDVRLLRSSESADLRREITRVTSALDSLFMPDHHNFSFLMNVDPSVHLHVIPRYTEPRRWADLVFDDPQFGSAAASDVRVLPQAVLAQLAEAIRSELPRSR